MNDITFNGRYSFQKTKIRTSFDMIRAVLQGDPNSVMALLPRWMLLAFVGLFVCARFEFPGVISCFQLAALTVSAAIFMDFRAERGLWMLAGLFFLIWACASLMILYAEVQDCLRGVAPPMWITADFAIGMPIMHAHSKFLWKVAVVNFAVSRE